MKVEEEIEFIKNLVNAHFNDGYHLIQAKDSQESVEQQVKRTQNWQVRIVMGILAFICLSIGINGLLHFDAFHELVGSMTLPADSKLILSGLTVFGIIFALIGIDPTLVMKMDSSKGFRKEFAQEIEPQDEKAKKRTQNFLDNLSLYQTTFKKTDQAAHDALTSLYSDVDEQGNDPKIPLGVSASINTLFANDTLYNLVLYGQLTSQGFEAEKVIADNQKLISLSCALNKIDSYDTKPSDQGKYDRMKLEYGQEFTKTIQDLCKLYQMSCQQEASAIVNRSDGKYGNLLPDTYRQKVVDNFVKNV